MCLALLSPQVVVTQTRKQPAAKKKTAQKAVQKKAPQKPANPMEQAARLNNLGVAYMGQQKVEKALAQFEQAQKLAPTLQPAQVNVGIALLNLQRLEPAKAALLDATRKQPKNPRGWFNLGLLYRSAGQPEPAAHAFERAAQLDLEDADTQYFLGFLYTQLQQLQKSVGAYQRALKLNPFHASAQFGLAKAYQRLGDDAKAREHLERFQRLTREKLATPISPIYGEQGKYSLAQQSELVSAVPSPTSVRFVQVGAAAGLGSAKAKPATAEQRASPSQLGPGACFLDFDNDGRPDLYVSGRDAESSAVLYRNLGGRFANVTQSAGLAGIRAGLGCSAGDYDNDGFTDLALTDAGTVRIFRNGSKGRFADVTSQLGIKAEAAVAGITFVDYDHDGDLDLYVTRFTNAPVDTSMPAAGGSNALWRNNGNGSFADVTEAIGLAGQGSSLGALATDFNNDRAVDFVVTGRRSPPELLLNPREGKFRELAAWPHSAPASTAGVVAFDFDKDGWMDLAVTQLDSPGLTLWRNVKGEKLEAVGLPAVNWTSAFGVAALDYDNDGWLDLAAAGETEQGGEIRLFRNRGPQGFEDITAATALDKINIQAPRALLVGDYDSDNDNDLLITQNGGDPVLLRNDGGNRRAALRLALKGLNDNKSAAGTKVEVFAGPMQQKWEITTSSGYLSQNAPGLLVGLAEAREADVVRLLWPTGVVQDEIELAAGKPHSIGEIDRRGSSCPVLFAWNGEKFEFISDVIGPSVIGHWIASGQTNVADPDEYVKVEGSLLKPRNGRLSLRFGEPMEEVNYLDQVRLLAVDHPDHVEIYPNERFVSRPPFPEFKVIASRGPRPPRAAWDSQGQDLLPQLLKQDRNYAAGFEPLSFMGFATLHSVTLDLGPLDAGEPLRLLLHGFTEYFTANSMYAAHQANLEVIVPYVEALDTEGNWVRILDDMGFPAGLPRMIVVDLTGKLPEGARQIRITTNMQIYWDQVLIDSTPDDVPIRVSEVPLAEARLQFLGYPRQVQDRPTPDLTYRYDEVSPTGPFVRHAGAYTRYGDVRQLLRASDDRFAVFGSGDEVALDFDPKGLPALPAGWKRDYLFFADGFVKDMDFYAGDRLTVEALPFHAMPGYPYPANVRYPNDKAKLSYLLDYNTRFYSGNSTAGYRFQYSPPSAASAPILEAAPILKKPAQIKPAKPRRTRRAQR
jgi:tetratricopeptide (TPR) repeat protein